MQHGSDYTPYEGLEVTGWPIKTLVRGVVVADNGCVVAPGDSVSSCREKRLGISSC